jgi:hypothetical protein
VWRSSAPAFHKHKWMAFVIGLISAIIMAFLLSGCASLEGILKPPLQKSTRTPIYVYKPELKVKVDGVFFEGIGVTIADQYEKQIEIWSDINIDRVDIETCGRIAVCQRNKPCDSNFELEKGWFGSAGKHMVYSYKPGVTEMGESCPLHVKIFDKNVLSDWFFLAFRNGETLPAHFTCNGQGYKYAGHSVCDTKSGVIQNITFEAVPKKYSVDPQCHMTELDDKKSFEIRPELGLCTGKFYLDGRWHGLDVIGWDEVIIK